MVYQNHMKGIKLMRDNLLIDATSFQRKMTGIEIYGYEICKEIFTISNKLKFNVTFLFHKNTPVWFYETRYTKCKIYLGNSKFLMEQLWIPYISHKSKIKNIFFPTFPAGLVFLILQKVFKLKIYRTIHDTIMWTMPYTVSIKNKLYMRPLERIGIFYYYHLFTVSNSSKLDLEKIFPKFYNNITITENALKSGLSISSHSSNILKDFNITPFQYILFVGTIEPRKNIKFLLQVMAYMLEFGIDIKLVLAGRIGWGHQELKNEKLYNKLKTNIVLTDFITDEDLNELYKNTIAFVYPSLYEGFGIPLIEAMKFRAPVIASNNSSIPEAVLGAGVLIDGYDAKDWAEKIIELKNNPIIREELVTKGYIRVKKLSWRKSSMNIIKKVICDEN